LQPTVTVIGGGLIGSAMTAELAERGVTVTLLEAGRLCGGTSGASFALLNSNHKSPTTYHEFNVAGMEAHRRFANSNSNATWYHPGGSLGWGNGEDAGSGLAENVERLQALDYPATLLSRSQVLELEPSLFMTNLPGDGVAYFPSEAWVDPPVLIAVLVEHARAHGADVITNLPVTDLEVMGNHVRRVVCPDRTFSSDIVINCAGPEADLIAQMAGIELPLTKIPGITVATEALPISLQRVIRNSSFATRPDGGGRLLAVSPTADSTITSSYAVTRQAVDMLLEEIVRLFPYLTPHELQVESVKVGVRPIPVDGLPILGFDKSIENLYQAVQHSGVTLCLELAHRVANHILDGKEPPGFDLYSVSAKGRHR